jgi:chitinase
MTRYRLGSRRTFAGALVLLALSAGLAACSANGTTPGVPSSVQASQAMAPPAAAPQAPPAAAPLAQPAGFAPDRKHRKKTPKLTAIATTFTYANGTITIVNASGKTQSLSQLELTFTDADPIASVWGSPWMAWQIASSANTYTLTGGTAYSTWPSGGTLTVSFTPPWNSTNVPSNVTVYQVPPAALSACNVTASESGGTISIVNASGAAIPLRSAELDFTYAGAIGNVWGTPWMAWSIARSGTAYTLTGGTNDATTLPAGSTLTAAFTPANGAHATGIVFKAACGAGASPAPSPSTAPTATPTTPAATPTPTAAPTTAPTTHPSTSPSAAPTTVPTALPNGTTQFVGFWESWSDTNSADAFYQLSTVPAGVTTTDVAFSIADDNTIAAVQNTYPLLPGAQTIHGHGGKLLLSFGGATSQFAISNTAQFVANLQAFMSANPGLYDGFDFDDEVMPWNGQTQLISVIDAVRAAFPTATISMDAFMSGADPQIALSTHQGEDVAVLQQAGAALDYVNVMDYDQYGWHPTDHPNCSYTPGATDDCREDVLGDFTRIAMPGGGTFPASKIVMGLMIGAADDGSIVTPSNATTYATWVRAHAYRGVMIWDLDRDTPGTTGYAKGSYVTAISTALGT